MQKFILHEAVASSVFNRNFTSGYGAWIPWEAELRNSPDILKTVCDRLGGDFEQTHAKLRKPYGMKDTESWVVTKHLQFDKLLLTMETIPQLT